MPRAVVLVSPGITEIREVEKPTPGKGEVLIRIHAAALNPTDVKHIDNEYPHVEFGTVSGCDLSGVVEALGPNVSEMIRAGDRVAAAVHGASSPNSGAFAEYAVADSQLVIHIPDSLSFEDAAGIALCATTACQMLWQSQDLPSPWRSITYKDPDTVLVWSAASAVGQYVIQLAAAAGLKVIGTASPKHWEQLKSLGASVLLDYKDPEVVSKIRSLTHASLASALDCMSDHDSVPAICSALGDAGGAVSVIRPVDTARLREDVRITRSVMYTIYGKDTRSPYAFPANLAHHAEAAEYCRHLSTLLSEGKLQPVQTRIFNGLEEVAKGVEYMRAGKVSGEKVTFSLV